MSNDAGQAESGGLGRRSLLKGAAVGGAAIWATPVVQTLGAGVAAAGTFVLEGCIGCQGRKPSMMRFTYDPAPCSQPPAVTCGSPAQEACTGGTPPAGEVTVTGRVVNPQGGHVFGPTAMTPGTTFDVSRDCSIGHGLGNSFEFTVTWAGGEQVVKIHTSCSAELRAGDQFASFTFEGGVFEC